MKIDVKSYFNGLEEWKDEARELRSIVLDCGLLETFKWMHPCYTFDGKNVVILHEFKHYFAISFFKGALLKDPNNILIQPTKNVQSGRQIRFTSVAEISSMATTLKKYIEEAIEIEKLGLNVPTKNLSDYEIPKELQDFFKGNIRFRKAFDSLTRGRQKGYLLHFTQPKQAATRIARIEKSMQRILGGYGLRDCVCGLSNRLPNCDGSHKQLSKP